MQTIGVIGAGAWGTALAQIFAKEGRDVLLWARESEVVDAINAHHENTVFLKGLPLDPRLIATNRLEKMAQRDILLLVSPAQHLRATLLALKPDIAPTTILVICAKGIEIESGKLLSDVCAEILPHNPVAILTGPTFAREIAEGLPAAVTIATTDKDIARTLQRALALKTFRPYLTDDIIGAQMGGALKNVIAIACGIIYGKGLGESASAALLTRGMAEIGRLTAAMGGKRQTLMGMCGLGDLILTATSLQSRNFSFGAALGQGQSMEEILSQRQAVTEGIYTAKATLALAKKHTLEMPITEATYKALHENVPVDTLIEDLLGRPLRGGDSPEREE